MALSNNPTPSEVVKEVKEIGSNYVKKTITENDVGTGIENRGEDGLLAGTTTTPTSQDPYQSLMLRANIEDESIRLEASTTSDTAMVGASSQGMAVLAVIDNSQGDVVSSVIADSSGNVAVEGSSFTYNGDNVATDADITIQSISVDNTELNPDANKNVNIPNATTSNYGVVKIAQGRGLDFLSDGRLYVDAAGETQITNRTIGRPLSTERINFAVKSALTDNNRLTMTSSEQEVAQTVLGVVNNVQPDWNESDSSAGDYIKNKPTIPTVNNPTITITQGGVTKGSFTLNQSTGDTIALDAGGGSATDVQVDDVSQVVSGVANLKTKNGNYNASTNKFVTESDLPTVPTKTSDLTNDGDGTSNFARLSDLPTPITITTTSGSESVSDGTNTLSFGSNAFNSTPIPTSYVSSVNGSTGAITDVAKTNANNAFSGDNNFTGALKKNGVNVAVVSDLPDMSTVLKNNTNGTIIGNSGKTPLTLRSQSVYDCFIEYKNSNDTFLGGIGVSNLLNRPFFNDGQGNWEIPLKEDLLNIIYPIGSIYLTVSSSTLSSSPASWLGGTWEMLPDGYALWTASSGAGNTIAAGLPNIKGTVGNTFQKGTTYTTYSGAFSVNKNNARGLNGSSFNNSGTVFDFNANSYNSIYSDDVNTVQPPAYKVYAWRRTA